ncbi:MAG: threonine-phosphate decarboxylase [Deltaproteobacteria bacterium]|nr:threonine-phosphate decarboxylase [Deltaproteobacteria bacterium]
MQVHGGNIAEISRKYNLKAETIIDFSSNINPLGYPGALQNILRKEENCIATYPDSDSTELRKEIAKRIDSDLRTILVGNGSTELIYMIPRVIKPKCALISGPTFSEYEKSLLPIQCELRLFSLKEKDNFKVHIDTVTSLLPKIDILYLCNPNNPTGVLLGDSDINALLEEAEKRGVLVVVDESFMDFTDNESVTVEVKKRKNLIVIKSLTKIYGIPGLRLGYLVANSKIVNSLNHHREPWTVNILAQKAGVTCLKDEEFIVKTKSFITREKRYLTGELNKIKGLKPCDSSTNYILIKLLKPGLTSGRVYERMAKQGLLIRDCRSFRGLGSNYIRVAVRKRKENNLLIKRLKSALER